MDIRELNEQLKKFIEEYKLAADTDITSQSKVEGGNAFYNPDAAGLGTYMNKQITSGIGKRVNSGGSKNHKGLDLDYNYGEDVYAFNNGTVTLAQPLNEFGRLIIIKDKAGYQHLYAHLSEILVKNGQAIKKGDLIGKAGGSGIEQGKLLDKRYAPHLHYGIWKPNTHNDATGAIDPRLYNYPD